MRRRCPHRLKLRQSNSSAVCECRHPSAVFKFHAEKRSTEGGEEREREREEEQSSQQRRRVTDFGIRQIPFKSRHFLSKTRSSERVGETQRREQGGLFLPEPKRRVENMEKVLATSWRLGGRFTRVEVRRD